MKALLSILSVTFLPLSASLACQPPPANYFEVGSIRSIIDSQEVLAKMGRRRITGINSISGGKYVVESNACTLEVIVEAKQMNPNFPCGGPYTFTVKPAVTVTCQN